MGFYDDAGCGSRGSWQRQEGVGRRAEGHEDGWRCLMRYLITGASSGIGRACAEVLSRDGHSLVLVARSEDRLQSVRAALTNARAHEVVPCDLSSAVAINDLAARLVAGGKLNGLVHAAGVGLAAPIGFSDEALMAEVFNVNYFAFMRLMRQCTKTMLRGGAFSAVAIASIAALVGWSGVSVYAGSKGALCASVRALAVELANKDVRVNAVCPGHTRTPMLDETHADQLAAKQPLGIVDPLQVAEVVAFLMGHRAKQITGSVISVDAGYTAQ